MHMHPYMKLLLVILEVMVYVASTRKENIQAVPTELPITRNLGPKRPHVIVANHQIFEVDILLTTS